jgi:ribokinase
MPVPIVIIGSSNTDMVIRADHIPSPGETLLGGVFFMSPGGKGANQAVAAARLGGNVIFICKTGEDIFGYQSVEAFRQEGIDTNFIVMDKKTPSGVAMITVDRQGENCIVVAPGANGELFPSDLEIAAAAIVEAGILLLQLEIPLATVEWIASRGKKKGKTILNPAPACPLPESFLKHIDIITPNEIEAEMLTGIAIKNKAGAEKAALSLRDRGVETVIITLGSAGALLLHHNDFTLVPASPAVAVDTTGAGDIFNGALAVALSEAKRMEDAVAFACRAASISVTKIGAQASAPYKIDIHADPGLL